MTALTLTMLLGVISAAAFAKAPSHTKLAARVSVSGSELSVQIRDAAHARCALRIATPTSAASLTAVTLSGAGRGTLRWAIPSNAASGTWTFSLACSKRSRIAHWHTQLVLLAPGAGAASSATPAPESEGPGAKGGGGQSCAQIATAPGGETCFIGDPFALYQGGTDVGQCTWYAAGMRPDLDGITTGNAGEWLKEAAGKEPEGTTPVVGAIAVNTTVDGGIGHVAYVAGVKNGGATLILDEANLNYDAKVYLNIETSASEFQGYIYGGPAGNGPGSSEASPPPPPPPPPAPTPEPPPAPTFAETSGSVVHTWSDYADAGGSEGPEIPSNDTVQIQCKTTGFVVADGNPWWYRIASSPWADSYYASADAFYNDGATSGSLLNTPFFDGDVPNC